MLHVFYNPNKECFKILNHDYEVREFTNKSAYANGEWRYIQLSPDDCIANLMQFARNETPKDEYNSDGTI